MTRGMPTLLILSGFALLLAACVEAGSESAIAAPISITVTTGPRTSTPTSVPLPTETPVPTQAFPIEVPFLEAWLGSAHADTTAQAFRHWDGEDPQQIPADCAKCHSADGYLDFIGADGSASGIVDRAAPVGTVITCTTCHNDAALALRTIVMPSEIEVTGLDGVARCILCHQGVASGAAVDEQIAGLAPDATSGEIAFVDLHASPAGATIFGSEAGGGYEYAGKAYARRFEHVSAYSTCTACHGAHRLDVEYEVCAVCHAGVESTEDLETTIRISTIDYDGDGDVAEGLAMEIETLRETLYEAIRSYAAGKGFPIIYDPHTYPYFFADTDGDGEVDAGEASMGNQYLSWTPRLIKAAYNLQYATNDPGAFAHNGDYAMQLLYDSIQDLGGSLAGLIRP